VGPSAPLIINRNGLGSSVPLIININVYFASIISACLEFWYSEDNIMYDVKIFSLISPPFKRVAWYLISIRHPLT
jgi:hypothetical protein